MPEKPERFSTPALNAGTITRTEITTRIDNLSQRGVLFICAPAGYGKTTAAVQWLINKEAAWFSVDEYPSMPASFFRGVLTALAIDIGEEPPYMPLEQMLVILQKNKRWPDALVVDDFHLCRDPLAARSLPLIRARMPADIPFIVLSRTPPPDPLMDHLLKGRIKLMTGLHFSNAEIIELFGKKGITISKHEAELIHRQTDGWAAVLAAILMSDSTDIAGVFSRETLRRYLRNHVLGSGDGFSVLMACSISDVLSPGLCAAITGRDDAFEIVGALADKTGLVTRLGENKYRLHALLKQFLETELQADGNTDIKRLYKKAALWHRSDGDWMRALDMAVKSGDIDIMEEISHITGEEFGSIGVDAARYVEWVEENLLTIPVHIAERYPRLSNHCFLCSFLSRPAADSYFWLERVETNIEGGFGCRSDYISAAFLSSLDPRRDSWHVPKQFERISEYIGGATGASSVLTIAHNFPFFHKAQRDYCDIAPEFDRFAAEIAKHMEPVLGSLFKPLALLIKAGIRYEQGRFEAAGALAARIVKLSDGYSPEIRFCALALHAEISRVQGKPMHIERIGDMIISTDAKYLQSNYAAFTAAAGMYEGDLGVADAWLDHEDSPETLKLYELYRHFITARALIVTGKLSAAEKLLERLAAFSLEYRRSADYIEALTLRSVCLWRLRHVSAAVEVINPAVAEACRLHLMTPVAKEGRDVLPILRRISNRFKYGSGACALDGRFVNDLFVMAQKLSENICGMFTQNKNKPVSLSGRQMEVLGYLAQNLSRQEISEKMGVKITTVTDHIVKLYEKLGVSAAGDALQRAKELGVADISRFTT